MRKWLIIALAALLALLAVPSVWLNTQQGLTVVDRFFLRQDALHCRADDANEISLNRTDAGTEFQILLDNQPSSALLTWDGDRANIEFDDGVIVAGDWNGSTLVNLDGELSSLLGNESAYAVSPSTDPETAALVQKGLLSIALCRIDTNTFSSAGSLILVIVGVVLYLLGMLNLFWPQRMFLLRSHLHYNYQELPADSARRAQILSGAVAMLGGAACMYATLLFR